MCRGFLIRAFGLCSTTLIAVSGCATTALLEQELTKTNTQTVLAFEETVYNKHEVQEAFEHYIGEGFVEHDPLLSGARAGRPGFDTRGNAQRAYRALITHDAADAHRTFERSIAQGELVATQSQWNRGARAGVFPVVDIYRLRQGRIVEHWDVLGSAGLVTGGMAGGRGAGGDAVPGESLPP